MCIWHCRLTRNCPAVFENLYELVSHMKSVHSSSSVTCGVDGCFQSFKSSSVWYWHVKRLESVCVSHLVKFKEIHRLSQAAITDIVEFVKLLHLHYVTKAQGEIKTLFETNDFQAPSMQQLLDCVESGCPLEGLESQTQELPYVVTYKVACACSHNVYVLCILHQLQNYQNECISCTHAPGVYR